MSVLRCEPQEEAHERAPLLQGLGEVDGGGVTGYTAHRVQSQLCVKAPGWFLEFFLTPVSGE